MEDRQIDAGIALIEAGRADVLVVWRWSRITRNRLDWAIAVDRVEVVGGRLESATEGFDTTTAVARFARGMLAEFAAYESDRMGDIWREALERRVRLGLPPTGLNQFGYSKVNGQYRINKRVGPVVDDLYRRYIAGESFASLCRLLRAKRVAAANPTMGGTRRRSRYIWNPSYLAATLDRGFAAGFIRYRGELLPGSHTPLITREEWATFLSCRERRKTRRPPERLTSPLFDGLVFCSCGNKMTLNKRAQEEGPRYTCYAGHGGRRQRTIRLNWLEGLLFAWLEQLLTDLRVSFQAREASARYSAKARDEI